MSEAIFFSVARHSKLKVRISELGRAAGRAAVERFFFRPRAFDKTPAPTGHLLAIARRANHLWAEENEIVREGCDQRHPIRVRAADKTEEQKGGRDPGQPFHFYRQNKKDVD